jgi:hypothetical protein
MPDLFIVDEPRETIQSVYSPIKYTARYNFDSSYTLAEAKAKYPSCRVSIYPRNPYTGVLETSRGVQIRLQPSIDIPNWEDDQTNNTDYVYYTIDVSSIARDFVSYDLRPCTHDTSTKVKRDITMGQISKNVFERIKVQFQLEYINSDGELDDLSGETDFGDFIAVNSALLHEEEHYLSISNELLTGSATQVQGDNLSIQYLHRTGTGYEAGRQKYLTTKPTNYRVIGHDECEYLSFALFDSGTCPRAVVRFYDANGNAIPTSDSSKGYVLVISKTTDGEGNLGTDLNSWGDMTTSDLSGLTNPANCVVQIGVGTRNIKESPDAQWNNDEPLTDFSNVSYYTVQTDDTGSPSDKIGEKVTYYIDHTRERVNGVRFHWQNRLGGIDSYTFDGAFTEGINISSKSYEQSIYPEFRGQLGSSTTSANATIGDNKGYHFASSNYGAVVPRVAGYTDDKYPSVRKSKVKAVKEGTAISRPYGIAEQDMFEDLLASPNVWIEKGWIGKEVFREDWSGYAAVTNISDKYHIEDGNLTSDAAFETADGHLTGTRTLRKGNEGTTSSGGADNDTLWLVSDSRIPYNPKSIYEVEVRIKSNASDSGYQVVGFTGFASNKTTKISTGGSDQYDNFHKITLEDYDQQTNDEWETFRGYVTGHSTTAASESQNINTASTAYDGVKYISPTILINHDDVAGETYIDYIVVREYQTDIPNSKGWYSTLNRNYYVPVVVKDASVTTFDNENLQRCTLNYIESKAKRTIE